MSEMTREEAITKLVAYSFWASEHVPDEVAQALDMAIEALKEQRPQWIPCKERLPEEDGKYLVKWCGDWGVDVCIAEYSHCGKYWYRDSDGYEFRDITAWMPLPEPYKRGEAE